MLLNDNKKQGPGCGSGILGTLAVIGATGVYAVISILICRFVISARLGDSIGAGIIEYWVAGLIISFLIFEGVFLYWQVSSTMKAAGKADGNKTKRIFRIVIAAGLVLSFAVALFCANTYTEFGEISISKICFVTTKEYTWDKDNNDVYSYSLECDDSNSFSFKVKMKDGETITVVSITAVTQDGETQLQAGSLHTPSANFNEKYGTGGLSLLYYAREIAKQINENGHIIDRKIVGEEHLNEICDSLDDEKAKECINDLINLTKYTNQ